MPKLRGMAVSRKGRPALGLQTLIDRLTSSGAKHAAVSLQDAEEAASVLERSRGRARRFRDASVVGGVMSPLVRGVGRAAEAAAMAPRGQRMRAALRGTTHPSAGEVRGVLGAKSTRGELAKHVFEGGLGGAAVNASREGLEVGRAKRKAQAFLGDKTASAASSIGKKRILMHAGDVWGHNTMAARQALSASGHTAHEALENAPTLLHHNFENAKTVLHHPVPAKVPAAPTSAAGKPQGKRRVLHAAGALGAGALGVGGVAVAGGHHGDPKLASSVLLKLAAKVRPSSIQPVRTSKLNPIIDDDIDYEV